MYYSHKDCLMYATVFPLFLRYNFPFFFFAKHFTNRYVFELSSIILGCFRFLWIYISTRLMYVQSEIITINSYKIRSENTLKLDF